MFDALRQMTPESVLFRLALAMLFGGMIWMERGRKGRAAGFRTYMLVCLGSALTMLLGQYEYEMLRSSWAAVAEKVGPRIDVGRFGAQVINGISFLGAGTIIVTGRQEVKGIRCALLSDKMSARLPRQHNDTNMLAIGAGFYECVLLAFLLIPLVTRAPPYVESYIVENARNMNIYVEFRSLDDVGDGGLVRRRLDQPHLPFRFHSESIALPEADFQITSWNSLLSHAHYIAPGIPVLALTKGL